MMVGMNSPARGKTKPKSDGNPWPIWLRTAGSVWFAVFLLAALTVLLIVSTSVESKLGTAKAQRFFYQAGWFDAFLALLGVNILSSTILRWPFKRKHTGFIVTHTGILALLVGSLLTRLTGAEGQMALYEGQSTGRIVTSELELSVLGMGAHPHEGARAVRLADIRKGRPFVTLPDGTTLEVTRFEEKAVLETRIEEGPESSPRRSAIRVRMHSELTGLDESFWLVSPAVHDPGQPARMLGPARIQLVEGDPPAEIKTGEPQAPRLLFLSGQDRLAEIDLSKPAADETAVGSTGFRVRGVRYYPDVRVGEDGKLVSVSEEPLNPAAEAELVAPDGTVSKIMKFALYPDFESMHGRPEQEPPFDVRLETGVAPRAPETPELSFHAGRAWSFRYRSPKGGGAAGEIRQGEDQPAGWMDFRFTAERLVERAVVKRDARPVAGKNGFPAVHLVARRGGQVVGSGWLDAESLVIDDAGRPLPVRLSERALPVPFELTLKDFRKVNYPGSDRPASFESDVTLVDRSQGLTVSKTIRMNQPLDHAGFRIFQSSYIEDPRGDASIFTVAKNPGIPLIYGGSIVLFIGMYLTFFVPSLSSLFKNTEK